MSQFNNTEKLRELNRIPLEIKLYMHGWTSTRECNNQSLSILISGCQRANGIPDSNGTIPCNGTIGASFSSYYSDHNQNVTFVCVLTFELPDDARLDEVFSVVFQFHLITPFYAQMLVYEIQTLSSSNRPPIGK